MVGIDSYSSIPADICNTDRDVELFELATGSSSVFDCAEPEQRPELSNAPNRVGCSPYSVQRAVCDDANLTVESGVSCGFPYIAIVIVIATQYAIAVLLLFLLLLLLLATGATPYIDMSILVDAWMQFTHS